MPFVFCHELSRGVRSLPAGCRLDCTTIYYLSHEVEIGDDETARSCEEAQLARPSLAK